MPRKTRLAIVSERPATDEEKIRMAGVALDEAEAAEHPLAAPEDILAGLRAQNAELVGVANAAVTQANQERARSQQLEQSLGQAKADQVKINETALQEVARARNEAERAMAATKQEAKVAERAIAAAGMMRQVVGGLGALVSFVVDRAPVLLTLAGAYLLSDRILAQPTTYQLALLAIYGGVAVAPAVYLSVRR